MTPPTRDEETASQIAVAFHGMDQSSEALPARLRERLINQGEAAIRAANNGPGVISLEAKSNPRSSTRRPLLAGLGWALAAAFAFALVVLRVDLPVNANTADARQALLADANVVRWPWRSDQVGYTSIGGDLVWSDERQAGYMRFVGLAVNDPQRSQYQLWIIDPDRDDAHPVDGGVFDVSSSGEVIIPITAKLAISDPKAFAITVEQPGGVVVSAGPLVLVAALGDRPS